MKKSTEIYVALLDEDVDVWRPVIAERLDRDVYRIVEQHYDKDTERWQFQPGDEVVCAMVASEQGPLLAAVRPALA
jgi:hypothetical protein